MRPVNLIPPEERPGGRKPLRSGPVAYMIVGALALAVVAVTALIATESKVSDRMAEVVHLESERSNLEAKATSLAAYSEFSAVREQRLATIASLASSRFDWEKVLAELSLVLPADIQLTSLNATASPDVSTGGGGGNALRTQIAGPALELVGCAPSQSAVAGFIEALRDIDGVTRVGVPSSTIGGAEGGGGTGSTCGSGRDTAQFQAVAGFDAAPVPSTEGSGEIPVEAAPEPAPSSGESTEASSSEEGAPS